MSGDLLHELLSADDQGRGGEPELAGQRGVLGGACRRERFVLPVHLLEHLGGREGVVQQASRAGVAQLVSQP